MPTERFYRLPREKAELIRQAAIKEFKRVRPEEASINRIIQDADISRGSFYTYFADKNELLDWVVQDTVKDVQRFYVKTFFENGGDIWDLFDKGICYMIELFDRDGLSELFKNLMNSSMANEIFHLNPNKNDDVKHCDDQFIMWLYRKRDIDKCPLENVDEFRDLVGMNMVCLLIGVKCYFQDGQTMEEVLLGFRRRMNLVRFGVCKR